MNRLRYLIVVPCFLALMCQKSAEKDNPLVKIGGKTIPQSSFDGFRKLHRMYPVRMGDLFPGSRSDITFMVETEILYGRAGSGKIKALSSSDWKWKQRFFPAQIYLAEGLDKDLGFTEKELKGYFQEHRADFKGTIQVRDTVKKATPGDSTSKDSVVSRDSTILKPFNEVRTEVVEKLFLIKNPPDTAFYNKNKPDSGKIDTPYVQRAWMNQIRNKLPDFFMRRLYQKKYGTPLVDSLPVIYGKGKPVTPADMEVILNWIPKEQRESYSSDTSRLLFLAQWLLKWELFSKEATRTGFAKTREMRAVLEWAKKVEAVTWFVDNTLTSKAKTGVAIDTAMCLFGYWDETSQIIQKPDSAGFAASIQKVYDQKIAENLNKAVYNYRKMVPIKFLQDDWKDDYENDPGKVLIKADSARDSSDSKVAESFYQMLARSFPFTDQGKQAFSELAKIQTENGQYRDAIQNYRHLLLWGADKTKQCNTFFMIGFIYDEYLDKSDMAEANYRWVLKYTPDCDLSDDAEFMVQHLDEPLTSVEELRDEAVRQGRNVDDTTAVEETDTMAAAAGAKK